MTENNFNWQEFHHGIYLGAPLQYVYEHLATPEGITKWFVGTAEYLDGAGNIRPTHEFVKTGDRFTWDWLEKDHHLKGDILEAVDMRRLRFTFGSFANVEITVQQEGVKTLLKLKQTYREGAEEDQFSHLNCCVCWVFFLTNLKSVIEGERDLRETDMDEEMLVNR